MIWLQRKKLPRRERKFKEKNSFDPKSERVSLDDSIHAAHRQNLKTWIKNLFQSKQRGESEIAVISKGPPTFLILYFWSLSINGTILWINVKISLYYSMLGFELMTSLVCVSFFNHWTRTNALDFSWCREIVSSLMKYIYLNGNDLQGNLPESLSLLTELKSMYLNANKQPISQCHKQILE